MVENKEIANLLKKGARLLELYGENSFKIRSYQKAARVAESIEKPIAEMDATDIEKIDGVGKNLAKKIHSIIESGTYDELDRLTENTPDGIHQLLNIKGIGPQKIKKAWEEQNITSPGELLEACKNGKAETIKGFGKKSAQSIREVLEYSIAQEGYFLLSEGLHEAKIITGLLSSFGTVKQAEVTGALRRCCEIIEEIDILVETDDPTEVKNQLTNSKEIISENGNFWSVNHNIPVKLHFANKDTFAHEKLRSTGSIGHIKVLEEFLNENAATEEEIYQKAGYPFIIPEMREGKNEWEKSTRINRDEIITAADLKGVLHTHTQFSDGKTTLEQLAGYCLEQGYSYLGIADHSQSAFYAGGLKPDKVQEQWEVIEKWNQNHPEFKVLKGIESDILKDGSLDYEEKLLSGFDFIVASVHSGLNMTEKEATDRLIRAIENPYTSMLGHPTGRLLLTRQGYPLDHEKILDACAANKVVPEVNANPHRLDIDWRWLDYAMEKGLYIAINPDAHSTKGVHDMDFGIMVSRKAALPKSYVLNALPAEEAVKVLKKEW